MKVSIVSTTTPFVEGGATLIVKWLGEALQAKGHQVETLLIPFSFHPDDILSQMIGLRLTDLSAWGERLIAIRTPSYLVRHPYKVLWFIHHHRGAYDLWGTKYQDIPDSPEGLGLRNAIIEADQLAFFEAKKLFTNSHVVKDRLKKFNDIDSQVLFPPLGLSERCYTADYSDYILYVSRVTQHKRQMLAVEALRYTATPVRLIIAGGVDPGQEFYLSELYAIIRSYQLEDRVQITARWISDSEKSDLFANCLAAIYMPYDEDSYGYPSLEAHHSKKAVITTLDAGGTLELINDGENGFVTRPDPAELANAMDKLYSDRALAKKMGEAGARRVTELGITWDHVVEQMLS